MTGETERPDRPVLTGMLALVTVAVVVGLVLAGVTLIASRMLGLDDGGSVVEGESEVAAGDSMYLPTPEETKPSGPEVTLATEDEGAGESGSTASAETSEPSNETSPATRNAIDLTSAQTQVANYGRIDLQGTFAAGEGHYLNVQRFQYGKWVNFGVTAQVSGGVFSTNLNTGVDGINKFRMIDQETGATSNVVEVRVG